MKNKFGVLCFTGLSGPGKTTLAYALANDLKQDNINPIVLDGDEIRELFQKNGFDIASRKKHNLEVGKMAAFFEKQEHIVRVSLISPFEDIRQEINKLCQNYIEIYVATRLETCIKRNTKGLFKKAIIGEITEFTGISSPYEILKNPALILETENMTVTECIKKIINKLCIN